MDRTPIRRRDKKRQAAAGGSGLSAVRNGNGKRETLHKRWGSTCDRLCQAWDSFEVVQSEREKYAGKMMTSFTVMNIDFIEKEVAILENIRKIRVLISETRNTRQQLLDRLSRLCNKLTIAVDSALFSNELHLLIRLLRGKARELMEHWVALEVHVKPATVLPPPPFSMSEIVNDVADIIKGTPAEPKLGFNANGNPFLHPSCPPKTKPEQLTQQEEVQIAKILRCLGKNMPYGPEWIDHCDSESYTTNTASDDDNTLTELLTLTTTVVAASVMMSAIEECTLLRDAVNEDQVQFELSMDEFDDSVLASPYHVPIGTKRVLSPLTPATPDIPDEVPPVHTSSSQQQVRRMQDRANTMRAIFDKGGKKDLPPLASPAAMRRESTPSKKRRSSTLFPAGPTCALEILRQVVVSERVSTLLSFMQVSVKAAMPESHQHFYLLSQLFKKDNYPKANASRLQRTSSEGEEESRLSQVFKLLNKTKVVEPFATSAKTRAGIIQVGGAAESSKAGQLLWRTFSAT